jgi:hypothetical protein
MFKPGIKKESLNIQWCRKNSATCSFIRFRKYMVLDLKSGKVGQLSAMPVVSSLSVT